ncbi:MAG TPA: hypothetical protein VII53_05820 [Solirubrobacteraceae bacterium]
MNNPENRELHMSEKCELHMRSPRVRVMRASLCARGGGGIDG